MLTFIKKNRPLALLAVLLLALAVVYGVQFWRSTPDSGNSAEVLRLVKAQHGKIPVFPLFQAGFHPPRSLQQRREVRYRIEAFFVAYARATPQQQREIVDFARMEILAYRAMVFARRIAAGKPPGHALGNWQAKMPQTIAHAMTRGNPQLNSAIVQFFMALNLPRQ